MADHQRVRGGATSLLAMKEEIAAAANQFNEEGLAKSVVAQLARRVRLCREPNGSWFEYKC